MSGEEYALQAIANLLEINGHQVDWFMRSSSDIQGFKKNAHAFFSGLHCLKTMRELKAFLQRSSFDVAIVQNLYPFLSPSILPVLREFNIPVMMRCPNYRLFCPNGLHLSHGKICEKCLGGREYWCLFQNCENNVFKSLGYALRNTAARLSRSIVDHVDLFVVLSEFQRMRFIAGGIPPERIEILPNIAPSTLEPHFEDAGKTVSFVGRISLEKGIKDFMVAAARLPDIPFAVAGDHHQMHDFLKSAPKNIQWRGFLSDKNLIDFFHQSRILLFPSNCFEGFPNVITNAMAAGKPVIASRLGGVPEIVDHERTGLLFAPGNLSEMVNFVKQLYADPALCSRLGAAGRVKAETVYSRGAVYKKLLTILSRTKNNFSSI